MVSDFDRNASGERRECRFTVNTNDLDRYKSTPDGDVLDHTIPDKDYDGEPTRVPTWCGGGVYGGGACCLKRSTTPPRWN